MASNNIVLHFLHLAASKAIGAICRGRMSRFSENSRLMNLKN